MIRLLLAALLLLPSVQDGVSPDQVIQGNFWDPEANERRAIFKGFGFLDHEKGTAQLSRVMVTFFTKPTRREASHTIQLFASRCDMEGVGEATKGRGLIRFYDGLRIMIDDEVRLWTPEGTLDTGRQILKCPKSTRLVHFTWPPRHSLASFLAFMDPQEVEWLKLFGAPEPDFELSGDEFEFDAASYVFTAGQNGRLRVKGRPGAPPPKRPAEPTELRSEGPLILRNLGAPEPEAWTTLHVTAERTVVVERRTPDSYTRATSDSASFYLALPPSKDDQVAKADPRPLSAVLSGSVRIEESRGFEAACDRLEWNHQDDLLRLTSAGRVELTQGGQKLQAREVVADRWNRAIEFKGDIVATFRPGRDAGPERPGGFMTLTPGDLTIRTDPSGRPIEIHARNGVRISSPMEGRDEGIAAEGAAFEWNLITGEGALRGAPFARVEQGPNLVVAPLVTFQGESFDKSLMVVKGPKVMRFFNEFDPPAHAGAAAVDAALGLAGFRPAPEEPTPHSSASLLEAALGLPGLQAIPGRQDSAMDLVITCDGDAVLDQVAGSVNLVDRCSVRTQDSSLFADRLFVVLTRTPRGLGLDRVLGHGNVRASRRPGPQGEWIEIEGETLEFTQDPATRERIVTVVGFPLARIAKGKEQGVVEKATLNLETLNVKLYRGGAR